MRNVDYFSYRTICSVKGTKLLLCELQHFSW